VALRKSFEIVQGIGQVLHNMTLGVNCCDDIVTGICATDTVL
jgi:hypothetical protein